MSCFEKCFHIFFILGIGFFTNVAHADLFKTNLGISNWSGDTTLKGFSNTENEKFRNHFVRLMQERKVIKKYTAVVVGSTIGSFSIEDPIGRDKFNRTKMSVRPDGKEALTFVKTSERVGNYSILDIAIETGRTHQIRVHLSSKKLPIIADMTYDPSRTIAKESSLELIELIRSFPRQALHARYLSFDCPKTQNDISFEIPIPLDIQNLIKNIKKHS